MKMPQNPLKLNQRSMPIGKVKMSRPSRSRTPKALAVLFPIVQSASEDSESNTEDLQQSLDKLAAAYNGINKEEIENIVKDHARSASIAAASAAWVSGAGPTMATMACGGFVWSMAYRLNKSIGIELSRNETKKAANAVLHTISSKEVTSFLAASGLSFIPVVGI
ncbi:MAG: hypothetical protein ACLSB9_25115 [Hydrogeniiclostridium mannosilyticum]